MDKKILIAEDEPALSEALTSLLSVTYTVIQAVTGTEALNKALSEHPDIILLDVIMPELNGMDVLKKLRQDPWGKNVPVLVLTNLTDLGVEMQAREFGVISYHVKANLKVTELATEIKNLLK